MIVQYIIIFTLQHGFATSHSRFLLLMHATHLDSYASFEMMTSAMEQNGCIRFHLNVVAFLTYGLRAHLL